MVVGPEFGPLAAVAVAIVRRRLDLARRARTHRGIPGRDGDTALGTYAGVAGWLSLANLKKIHEVDLIFQVGPISLVVALLAGAAGMLSLVSSKSAALVGVFISVTTVPAAGFAVIAAAVGDWASRRIRTAARRESNRDRGDRSRGAVDAAACHRHSAFCAGLN